MSYSAKVFNVMIASPSDDMVERKIVKEVLYEWNENYSVEENIVLLPMCLENHLYYTSDEQPEDIIDMQMLEKCDLLISMFCKNICKNAQACNSENNHLTKAHRKEKLAMFCFSSTPFNPTKQDQDLLARLMNADQDYEKSDFYTEYDGQVEFKEQLSLYLQSNVGRITSIFIDNQDRNKIDHKVLELQTDTPSLSVAAQQLLKQCSIDKDGNILRKVFNISTVLRSNHRDILLKNERWEFTKFERALDELLFEGLVEPCDKSIYYKVTKKGYEMVGQL